MLLFPIYICFFFYLLFYTSIFSPLLREKKETRVRGKIAFQQFSTHFSVMDFENAKRQMNIQK